MCLFDGPPCNSAQIRIHKSASFALGPMHLSSPLNRPSIIPFVVLVHHRTTDIFPEETQESRQLTTFVPPALPPAYRTSRVYVDDIKLAGKKQNTDPMWKELMKDVDLGEPTSSLDHVYLGCTQQECETRKDIVENTEICLNPEFLWEQKKSYFVLGNPTRTSLHGPMTWKVMQRNVWSDIASWRTKTPATVQSRNSML